MNNLAFGIPTMGSFPWQFGASLMALGLPDKTRVIYMVRSMIYTARNKIVTQAMQDNECTHVMMIDDDMTFAPDFAFRLLKHFEENPSVDIVGGLAFKRRPNYEPCVFRKNEKDGEHYPILPEVFQEVDVIGTGGIMIKMDVFKKLKFPWFENYYDEQGRNWSVDFDFCIKAKKAGFKIFCDPEALMGHIGDAPVISKNEYLKHVQYIEQQGRTKDLNNKKNDTTNKNNNK